MAEKQQSHRHRMEERAMRSSITLSGAGLVTGFLIGLAGLGAATWMVILNHDTAGIIIGSADLVALVSVFVYGKRRSRNEDGSKSQKRSRVDSNRVEDDSPRQESKPNNDEGSPDH
jgi:hypothetical protein